MQQPDTYQKYQELREPIKHLISHKLDVRFNALKTDRATTQRNWDITREAVATGKGQQKIVNGEVVKGLTDNTISSMSRLLHARESVWIDTDFFQYEPDGAYDTDEEAAYWLTEIQRAALNNKHSGFHSAIRAVIWDRSLYNFGACRFKWCYKPKKSYKYTPSGLQALEQPYACAYQGVLWERLNPFDVYPDTIEQKGFVSHSQYDIYLKEESTFGSILKTPEMVGVNYAFESNVVYRDTEYLKQLVDQQSAGDKSKEEIELTVKTAYVKALPSDLEGLEADERGFRVVWVCFNNATAPVFIERLPFDFADKPIAITRKWIETSSFYGPAETGLAIDNHEAIVYAKEAQLAAVNKASNPPMVWATQLKEAINFKGQGTVEQELSQGGRIFWADFDKMMSFKRDITQPIPLGGNIEVSSIPLYDNLIQRCVTDIQQVNVQVTREAGSSSTAAFVNQQAKQQEALTQESIHSIKNDVILSGLQFYLAMAKSFYQPIKHSTRLTAKDKAFLLAEKNSQLEEEGLEPIATFEELAKVEAGYQKVYPEGEASYEQAMEEIKYDFDKQTKSKLITADFFNAVNPNLQFKLEASEYDKKQDLAELVQLFSNLIANTTDERTRQLLINVSAKRALQLTNDPAYSELAESFDDVYKQSLEPAPLTPQDEQQMQLAQMEAEASTADKQAAAKLKEAQAEEETARADKQNIENAMISQPSQMI